MYPINNIVVPTDFSDCSLVALDHALRLAKGFEAKLHLLHVLPEMKRGIDPCVETARRTFHSAMHDDAQANFASLVPRVRGAAFETATRCGYPSSAIAQYAVDVKADLIVMATHARRGLAHFLVGSTTEEVVRRASCPVMTVHPSPLPEEPAESGTGHEVRTFQRRGDSLRVRDAMRRDVVTANPSTPVHRLVDQMIRHDLSGIPVVEADNVLVGYVAESQLMVRSLAGLGENPVQASSMSDFLEVQREVYGRTAGEIMRPVAETVTISEGAMLTEAVHLMLDRHVSRMPVLHDDKLVGYLTRADILRVVSSLDEQNRDELDDVAVAGLVRQALDRSSDVAIESMRVEAEHGLVHLHGAVSTREEMESASAIATRVPGVKAVVNCLVPEQMLR